MNTKLILFLFATLFIVPCGWGAEEKPDTPITKVKRIGVEEYNKLSANTNHVLLDVRSKEEFKTGHIPGAVNIDINSATFAQKIGAFDKSKTYLVNCAVGMRSARACKKMEAMGFKELYDFGPGFDGWKKAGKPVEK